MTQRSAHTQVPACEVDACLELIAGKWKSLILWKLSTHPHLHFGELQRAVPGITQKMLTQQLRALEHDELVVRVVSAEKPLRVRYSLSSFGETLRPVLEVTAHWGRAHRQHITTILQKAADG